MFIQRFVLQSLFILFLVGIMVNLHHFFPQIEEVFQPAQLYQAPSSSQLHRQARLFQEKLKAHDRQIAQFQQQLPQTGPIFYTVNIPSEEPQQYILIQPQNERPLRVTLKDNCYFDCKKQNGGNDQFC